jgi:hypothetical protein
VALPHHRHRQQVLTVLPSTHKLILRGHGRTSPLLRLLPGSTRQFGVPSAFGTAVALPHHRPRQQLLMLLLSTHQLSIQTGRKSRRPPSQASR